MTRAQLEKQINSPEYFKCTIPNQPNLKINLRKLDDWLIRGVGLRKASIDEDIYKQEQLSFLFRVGLFLTEVLQLSGVPIFTSCQIIEAGNTKDLPTVLGIEKIEHIPPKYYILALQSVIDIIAWMHHNEINANTIQQLHNHISFKIITPIQAWTLPGKSLIPLLKVAYQLKIPFIHLGMEVYQLGWGCKAKIFRKTACENDSAIGSALSHNKYFATSMIRKAGLPSPTHQVASTVEHAKNIAKILQYPLVAKPIDADRGQGVTIDIFDEQTLEKAFAHAIENSQSKNVLIEQQVDGMCNRLFIQNGKLLYAVKRLPRYVEGNGRDSVQKLLSKSNAKEMQIPPWKRSPIIPLDEATTATLSYYGYTPYSIPAEGIMVPIRRIESSQWGGEVEDISHCIHKDNLQIAIQAAKLFHLEVVGVDIITSDISIPWHENGAIINEINYMPMIGASAFSQSHIAKFIGNLIEGDGKITIVYAANFDDAHTQQNKILKDGLACYITSENLTIAPNKDEIKMRCTTLKSRFESLILNRDVQAIVIFKDEI